MSVGTCEPFGSDPSEPAPVTNSEQEVAREVTKDVTSSDSQSALVGQIAVATASAVEAVLSQALRELEARLMDTLRGLDRQDTTSAVMSPKSSVISPVNTLDAIPPVAHVPIFVSGCDVSQTGLALALPLRLRDAPPVSATSSPHDSCLSSPRDSYIVLPGVNAATSGVFRSITSAGSSGSFVAPLHATSATSLAMSVSLSACAAVPQDGEKYADAEASRNVDAIRQKVEEALANGSPGHRKRRTKASEERSSSKEHSEAASKTNFSGGGHLLPSPESRLTARRPSHLSASSFTPLGSFQGGDSRLKGRRPSQLSAGLFSFNGFPGAETEPGRSGSQTPTATAPKSLQELEQMMANILMKKPEQRRSPEHSHALSAKYSEGFDGLDSQAPLSQAGSFQAGDYANTLSQSSGEMEDEQTCVRPDEDAEEDSPDEMGGNGENGPDPRSTRKSFTAAGNSMFQAAFGSGWSAESATPTMDLGTMRQQRVSTLLAEAYSCGSGVAQVGYSLTWLRVSGILSWTRKQGQGQERHWAAAWPSHVYRGVVLVLLLGVVLLCLHQFMQLQNEDMGMSGELNLPDLLLPVLAIALACFSCIFLLMWQSDWAAGDSDTVLTSYAYSQGLIEAWTPIAYQDMLKMLTCWAIMVSWSAYITVEWKLGGTTASVCVATFAVISNVFASLMFAILHICRGLLLALDNFCICFVLSLDCDAGVHDWNLLQAVLRQVCHTVAPVYVLLLSGSVAAISLPVLYQTSLWAMVPGGIALMAMFWVSVVIGEVTSKCDRVSVFVNMIEFADNLDERRSYLVNFITNSRAGFYMFEVRITAEMVVKSAYVGAVLVVFFTTARMENV